MEVLATAENSPLLVAYIIVPLIVLAAGANRNLGLVLIIAARRRVRNAA